MRLLGAILRGGQSRRFGSDKALALLDGRPLLDHVIERLHSQVAALVLCGGPPDANLPVLADRPQPGLGPLAGLLAALAHAGENGFDAVMAVPCDTPHIPCDLADRLGRAASLPAIAASGDRIHPVIGLWPAELAPRLEALLLSGERRAGAWADQAGAQIISFGDQAAFANVNDAASLAALQRGRKN